MIRNIAKTVYWFKGLNLPKLNFYFGAIKDKIESTLV